MSNELEALKQKPKYVEKEWGHELWLFNDEELNICSKILFIKKGSKFSMHMHYSKSENFFVQSGKCILRIHKMQQSSPQTVQTVLDKGESFFVDRLTAHQLEALEDTTIIETSTFHRDEDSYRLWR